LFKKRPILTTFILVIYVGIILTFSFIAKNEKTSLSSTKEKSEATAAIINSIQSNKDIENLSNKVKVIFRSHDRKSKGELSEYGLVSLLEDTFTSLSSGKPDSPKLDLLMNLIIKEKEKDPYYGLKFEQEVIIKNLESKLTESTQIGFIDQVKEVVRRQNVEIDELKKSNAWGVPVGIAGVVLTILFGIVSLIYPALTRNKG
jgi:hypothetical protein